MLESNISGLLGLSKNDGDGGGNDYGYAGNMQNRRANRDKHYHSSYRTKQGDEIDLETGEILNFKPNSMAKQNFSLPKVNLPNPATVINIALIAGVGLVGYKLYNKFFGSGISDILEAKADAGSKAIANLAVDDNKVKADTLNAAAASLKAKNLLPNQNTNTIALYLHDQMDSVWVDGPAIVSTIIKMQAQTFRLVSVSYGAKTLKTYCDYHIWAFASKARNEPINLADSLKLVLSADELTKIHSYLVLI